MDSRGLLLVFVCLVIAFYLNLNWLVILLAVFLFLVVLGSLGTAPKRMAVPRGPEEIIYPVIYEDVGEPPFLYHPNMELEVNPNWTPMRYWGKAAKGMGDLLKVTRNVMGGKVKSKEEDTGE